MNKYECRPVGWPAGWFVRDEPWRTNHDGRAMAWLTDNATNLTPGGDMFGIFANELKLKSLRRIIMMAAGSLLLLTATGWAQEQLMADTAVRQPKDSAASPINIKPKKGRVLAVSAFNVAAYGGSLVALNKLWYADYPRRGLHSFNDSKEWMQIDKAGHAFSAYLEGKYSMELWRWAGLNRKQQIWIGGLSGAVYQTAIEFLDGTSAQWGWSWPDFAANLTGSALLVGQELAWNQQRIQFKVSYHTESYDPSVLSRAHDLYGKGGPERFLKDYNGQTHWLSVNLRSFFPQSRLPKWLNVAVGHGATGMLGGFENKWEDAAGSTVTRYDIKRQRQWYLAPDIDFTKIPTRKKLVRYCLEFLNMFKFPAPGLELTGGKLKLKGLAF